MACTCRPRPTAVPTRWSILAPPGQRAGTIDQPAATLWYHLHLHGLTEDHVYRGLAGVFLLDDPQASAMPLPNRYGVDDIPVLLTGSSMSSGDHSMSFGTMNVSYHQSPERAWFQERRSGSRSAQN